MSLTSTPRLAFTSAQVLELLRELDGEHLPLRSLADWATRGLVEPTCAWARRRRCPRLYSRNDVAKVRLVLRLRRGGLSMARTRPVLSYLELAHPDVLTPHTRAVLGVSGWRAYVRTGKGPDVEAPSGQLRLQLADVVLSAAEVEVPRAGRQGPQRAQRHRVQREALRVRGAGREVRPQPPVAPQVIAVDSGYLFALADARDAWHRRAVEASASIDEGWVTTWPVLAEACHLLRPRLGASYVPPLLDDVAAGTIPAWRRRPSNCAGCPA